MVYFFIYDMKIVFRYFCIGLFLFFTWPFFLYKKYGNKKYKLQGRTLIVANHYSNFDPFFIYLIYGRKKIYFVTIIETKKKLLSRFVTWLFDCLFIDYNSSNFGFFKQCLEILKNDGIICIFPEGAINPRKRGFFEFKNSFIFLAKKTNANVLPLYIYPALSFFKKSKVYIGDIITPQTLSQYDDLDVASIYVLSKIMDYSIAC